MESQFIRSGPLMELSSYPEWLREIVDACDDARRAVVEHQFFRLMHAGELPAPAMQRFLASFWPVIEQFPQYMAMNLLKVQYGLGAGHAMARKYLIRNIRVEQNHVEYWMDWSREHGLSREALLFGLRSNAADALSHWCWHTCERDPLPVAMAATNYAIEGTTGEWAAFVCSSLAYEHGFAVDVRKQAMKWLRVHAHYDDTHPWEAMEIIATLLGQRPEPRDVASIEAAILKSYRYMSAAFDDCLVEGVRLPVSGARMLARHLVQISTDGGRHTAEAVASESGSYL